MPRCLACGGPLSATPTLVGRDRMHSIPGSWAVHACRDCGSGTTLPLASEQELAAFYPQTYAPFDIPRGPLATVMRLMQRARDRRFPLAELRAANGSRTLLDVGCGRGDLAASWLAAGWRVLGIEPSPEAARTASARGAEIIGETLSTTQLEPECVDAVVFRHSLEHVVEPRVDLRRVSAALRRGGRLAVIVPNWGSWQRRAFHRVLVPARAPASSDPFHRRRAGTGGGPGGFRADRHPAGDPVHHHHLEPPVSALRPPA